MNIDLHCHFVPRNCVDVVDEKGRHYGQDPQKSVDKKWDDRKWDIASRIKDMDATGVDMQAISPSPALFYYDRDPESCLWWSQRLNDGIAEAVKECPSRFIGLATVPLQDTKLALSEADRAINKLGLRGIIIGAHANNHTFDSPEFLPFFKEIANLDVPVFIHPKGADTGMMAGYHLGNLVGNPLETTLAAANLIFGGILEKFPGLKFYLAHAGGNVPYLKGRWEHGYQVRAECKLKISHPPSYYLPLLYFDTITHSAPALQYLINEMGSDRVVMGTDYPADMCEDRPVFMVQSVPGISDGDRRRILGDNAARLFKL